MLLLLTDVAWLWLPLWLLWLSGLVGSVGGGSGSLPAYLQIEKDIIDIDSICSVFGHWLLSIM
jgi:hypothetical protein